MSNSQIVESILSFLGGKENIVSVTNCMTRLRVTVRSEDRVLEEKLKQAEKVLGLVHDRRCSYEIVVGPGNSRQFADICHEMGCPSAAVESSDWQENKAAYKAGQKSSRAKALLKIIGDIFVPLIPGIIAAGLCAGFASLITQLVPDYESNRVWYLLHTLLTVINVSFMTYITAWSGYRAAERFGATPVLGGMLGMITSLAQIDTISQALGLYNADTPLQSILRTGKGGVLAVICGVFVLSVVEKRIRRKMPSSVDIIFTPLLTLIICCVPYILIIMPALGYVSNAIVWVFSQACMSESVIIRIIVGYAASALFLPLVASGMHHGLVALYTVQLQELGFITLYPALAMAGAGQVGAAIALHRKARRTGHKRLCSVINGALPAGLLGVGEPLIYGVTLPMGRPFLTAGLGAGFGGAFVMLFQVASTTWGPSGLLGAFVMTAGPRGAVNSMLMYLAGLVIACLMSYLITNAVISDKEVTEALGGLSGEPAEALLPVDTVKNEDADLRVYQPVRHGEPVVFGFGETKTFEHVIRDPVGIHARPAGELSKLVSELGCEVTVKNGERSASGKSVIELMMLDASRGSKLEITVSGANASDAAGTIRRFMREKL